MFVYLDKNFVRSFWSFCLTKEDVYDDFRRNFLQRIDNYTLVTNFESEEEILMNEDDTVLFEDLFMVKCPKMEYVPFKMDDDFIQKSTEKGGCHIFFSELDVDRIDNLEKKWGYEIFSSKSLIKKWEKYYRRREVKKSLAIPQSKNNPLAFNSWEDLNFVGDSPNNCIIVVDKYVLSDKKNSPLKDNLFPLIENIIPKKRPEQLNIIIFSQEILSDNRKRIKSIEERAEEVLQRLNSYFAKYKPIIFKFTIIYYNNKLNPKDNIDIHDRYIYTNYYTIEVGSGFDNLFKGKRRKVVNSKLRLTFNYEADQMEELPWHFDGLKKYVNHLQKNKKKEAVFKYLPKKFSCSLINIKK